MPPTPRSPGFRRCTRILNVAAIAAGALVLSSCFEAPIRESLELRFLADGAVQVQSTSEIASTANLGDNPGLLRRVTEAQQQVLKGEDPWSARFAALSPAVEGFSWEKRDGEVQKAVRSAIVARPESLARFFADTPLEVSYEIREGTAELVMTPGRADRATRQQRRALDQALDGWSGAVARYLAAVGGLYDYLEDHPDRATPCLGSLYSSLLPDGERKHRDDLTGPESERMDRLDDAMGAVAEVLRVGEGQDHSLDEISHLVFDPFPARLTVQLPGAPLEMEGFAAKGKELTAAGPGLWQALSALQGRWVSPDPILLHLDAEGRERKEPVQLSEILRQPRRAEAPPSALEVRQEIERRLQPARVYRATWQVEMKGAEGAGGM
jgi:hypothetical protein